jgi:hypothetical protein
LPLYVFCGRELLLSKLRPANIDAAAGQKRRSPGLSPSFARHGPMSLVVSHESEVLNGRILKYKTGMSDIGVNSQGA